MSGALRPFSHLLTACAVTPIFMARRSCVMPYSKRRRAMRRPSVSFVLSMAGPFLGFLRAAPTVTSPSVEFHQPSFDLRFHQFTSEDNQWLSSLEPQRHAREPLLGRAAAMAGLQARGRAGLLPTGEGGPIGLLNESRQQNPLSNGLPDREMAGMKKPAETLRSRACYRFGKPMRRRTPWKPP